VKKFISHRLVFAIVFFLLTGCFPSKDLKTLELELSQESQQLTELESLEKTDPEKALKQYGESIAKASSFNKPLIYYQNQLRMQLRQMGGSDVQVLGDHVLTAFPFYYQMRLGTLVRAHLGLSRIALAQNNLSAAEENAKKAVEIINGRTKSSLFIAQEGLAVHKVLSKIYKLKGSRGKVLLSKLNEDLLEDFLQSEYASEEIVRQKEAASKAQEQMQEIDKFISRVNSRRTAKAIAELASAVNQVIGGLNMGDSATLKTTKLIASSMEVATASISASFDSPSGQGVERYLSPMANTILISQFLDQKKGVHTERIIKDFVSSAKLTNTIGNDASLAEVVLKELDTLLLAKDRHDEDKIAAVKKFAAAFNALQTQLQNL